jgi:hypothetical protein
MTRIASTVDLLPHGRIANPPTAREFGCESVACTDAAAAEDARLLRPTVCRGDRLRSEQAVRVEDLDAQQATIRVQVNHHPAVHGDDLRPRLAGGDAVDEVDVRGATVLGAVRDSHRGSVAARDVAGPRGALWAGDLLLGEPVNAPKAQAPALGDPPGVCLAGGGPNQRAGAPVELVRPTLAVLLGGAHASVGGARALDDELPAVDVSPGGRCGGAGDRDGDRSDRRLHAGSVARGPSSGSVVTSRGGATRCPQGSRSGSPRPHGREAIR